MFNITDLVAMALKLEKNGERVYRQAAGRIADDRLKRLLLWMADEEVKHAEWLLGLERTLPETAAGGVDEKAASEGLQDIIGKKGFSLDDVDFETIRHPQTLISIFIEFEEDSILFFKTLEAFIHEPRALDCLNAIIAEEKRHIARLDKLGLQLAATADIAS